MTDERDELIGLLQAHGFQADSYNEAQADAILTSPWLHEKLAAAREAAMEEAAQVADQCVGLWTGNNVAASIRLRALTHPRD